MDEIIFRRATAADLPEIVTMLADDPLGSARESVSDLEPYESAFRDIDSDGKQLLLVAEQAGRVVGTAQVSFLAGLSRRGAMRGQIEAVRVASGARGSGLGTRLIEECVRRAHERGCVLVQLTSDASRTEAHRFYERLGFEPTHIGFKRPLPDTPCPTA
ncbi:GNAT family N-acetyltransferase [Nocardia sp. NEAU-G5]|uniref:GNAT family N-acetyltransferase n=1 Tax=Nocardia albiluteola TaxID=2842303 RepID=A0ABS6AZX9_9NOCA|nr:GNAT family N-acetyltransferase [Nocardia albiluteola]MBU3063549.1 GNAT family N-acetyltransferase [Nocardia albiluteola]